MMDESTILLVEDDSNDSFLMERAFRRGEAPQTLRVVRSGQEALRYLGGEGEFANRGEHPLPFLALIDLKMPGISGLGVIEWIRNQPHLGNMLVVALTSSDQDADVRRAFELGAHSFLVKPGTFDDLCLLVSSLQGYLECYRQKARLNAPASEPPAR